MKRFHLIFGFVLFVVFLLTGQYMEYVGNRHLPDVTRMLYRSRHIYLLLTGLVNLVIGTYFVVRAGGWRRTLQIAGSLLIVLSTGLLMVGFFTEPRRGPDQTVYAPMGIYAVALGTLLHVLSGIGRRAE